MFLPEQEWCCYLSRRPKRAKNDPHLLAAVDVTATLEGLLGSNLLSQL